MTEEVVPPPPVLFLNYMLIHHIALMEAPNLNLNLKAGMFITNYHLLSLLSFKFYTCSLLFLNFPPAYMDMYVYIIYVLFINDVPCVF